MKKRGELTTKQIVSLIILIISFTVILFLLLRLNLGEETQTELCHNSVVTRGNSLLSETTPLNCKTEYICLTVDGTCDKMTNPTIKKVKSEEEVYEVLAGEMAECWWMFGEGEIDYVGKEVLKNLYCSLCDQIAFDDSLNKFFPNLEFDEKNLHKYMETNNYSNDETYSKYVFGRSLSSNQNFKKINLSNQYYILMGLNSKGTWQSIIKGAAIGGITLSLVAAPFTMGGSLLIAATIAGVGTATGSAGGYLFAVITQESAGNFMRPNFVEANSKSFEIFDCKDINTLA